MNSCKLLARGKINLSLDIVGKREDGYHLVKMVMQTISLYDIVSIKRVERSGIWIKTDLSYLPTDERNIAYKAASLMQREFNLKGGILISIKKNIPVAAGLGGGSADCAAVIIGINKLYNLGLSINELTKLGERLGSDVPFCILGGTALAEGVGERITILPNCPELDLVLIKPSQSLSTASVYKRITISKIHRHPNTEEIIKGIRLKDKYIISKNLYNVLENVSLGMLPKLRYYKNILRREGAIGVAMSGSGPTVFGIFENKDKACRAADTIRKELKVKVCRVVKTYNDNGMEME